jgi:hypothetical protein
MQRRTVVISGTTPSLNGITFPATPVASADANTLDDYEEGTWTAIMTADSGTITVNNGASKNSYTKVGRLVTLTVATEVSSVSSPVGRLAIGGFPFNLDNATTGSIGGGAVYAVGLTGDPGGFSYADYPRFYFYVYGCAGRAMAQTPQLMRQIILQLAQL